MSGLRDQIEQTARACGFDRAGVARLDDFLAAPDVPFFRDWLAGGRHGSMAYLEGERAAIRSELNRLLPGTRSAICLAVNYNTPLPYSTSLPDATRGWIARYAWGDDYHGLLHDRASAFIERLRPSAGARFEARVCVDTSPVLERALARLAGIGWTGKNTCIINQQLGSWLLLAEVLTTLELDAAAQAPDRCGTCMRCINACPTQAILAPRLLDSRLCISYWTIEAKGAIDPEIQSGIGRHLFGCDICQDVCPWNSRAAISDDPAFRPREGLFDPPLEELGNITEDEFRAMFRGSPIKRPKYRGFMRNVCVAMGNSGDRKFVPHLELLSSNADPLIAQHARWALDKLDPATKR